MNDKDAYVGVVDYDWDGVGLRAWVVAAQSDTEIYMQGEEGAQLYDELECDTQDAHGYGRYVRICRDQDWLVYTLLSPYFDLPHVQADVQVSIQYEVTCPQCLETYEYACSRNPEDLDPGEGSARVYAPGLATKHGWVLDPSGKAGGRTACPACVAADADTQGDN